MLLKRYLIVISHERSWMTPSSFLKPISTSTAWESLTKIIPSNFLLTFWGTGSWRKLAGHQSLQSSWSSLNWTRHSWMRLWQICRSWTYQKRALRSLSCPTFSQISRNASVRPLLISSSIYALPCNTYRLEVCRMGYPSKSICRLLSWLPILSGSRKATTWRSSSSKNYATKETQQRHFQRKTKCSLMPCLIHHALKLRWCL